MDDKGPSLPTEYEYTHMAVWYPALRHMQCHALWMTSNGRDAAFVLRSTD